MNGIDLNDPRLNISDEMRHELICRFSHEVSTIQLLLYLLENESKRREGLI